MTNFFSIHYSEYEGYYCLKRQYLSSVLNFNSTEESTSGPIYVDTLLEAILALFLRGRNLVNLNLADPNGKFCDHQCKFIFEQVL